MHSGWVSTVEAALVSEGLPYQHTEAAVFRSICSGNATRCLLHNTGKLKSFVFVFIVICANLAQIPQKFAGSNAAWLGFESCVSVLPVVDDMRFARCVPVGWGNSYHPIDFLESSPNLFPICRFSTCVIFERRSSCRKAFSAFSPSIYFHTVYSALKCCHRSWLPIAKLTHIFSTAAMHCCCSL